jgi:hypothetical protein
MENKIEELLKRRKDITTKDQAEMTESDYLEIRKIDKEILDLKRI